MLSVFILFYSYYQLFVYFSGLSSPAPEKRQGVCVGLSEIMSSTSRDMVLSFVNSLVPTVRRALCDESPEVRAAAAKTFDSLHNTVGSRALGNLKKIVIHLDEKFIFYFSFSEIKKS